MAERSRRDAPQRAERPAELHDRLAWLGHLIGRSRLLVLLAVLAVLLAAFTLFLVGAVQAAIGIWGAWRALIMDEAGATALTVEFLGTVTVMLKAVVFYLIGVGLYSLFIGPLNLSISLGVETLTDLEARVVSIVILIIAVTFLERFIRWGEPADMLMRAAAGAIMVSALVLFQLYGSRERERQRSDSPEGRSRAKREVFEEDRERHEVNPEEVAREKDS